MTDRSDEHTDNGAGLSSRWGTGGGWGYGAQASENGGGWGYGWHLLMDWVGSPRGSGNCDGSPEYSNESLPVPEALYRDGD